MNNREKIHKSDKYFMLIGFIFEALSFSVSGYSFALRDYLYGGLFLFIALVLAWSVGNIIERRAVYEFIKGNHK